MTRVETFRQSFHEKYKSTNSGGVLHIIGVLCVGIGGIIGPLFFIENLHLQDLLIIPATFLYANLVEYLMHRFPMHRKIKPIGIIFERHTLEHHYFFHRHRTNDETLPGRQGTSFSFLSDFYFYRMYCLSVFTPDWAFFSLIILGIFSFRLPLPITSITKFFTSSIIILNPQKFRIFGLCEKCGNIIPSTIVKD